MGGGGVIVRILVLPGHSDEAIENLAWLATEVSNEVAVSVMAQYTPAYKALETPPLDRSVTKEEYESVVEAASDFGFSNGWIQGYESSDPERALLGRAARRRAGAREKFAADDRSALGLELRDEVLHGRIHRVLVWSVPHAEDERRASHGTAHLAGAPYASAKSARNLRSRLTVHAEFVRKRAEHSLRTIHAGLEKLLRLLYLCHPTLPWLAPMFSPKSASLGSLDS